MVAPQGSDEHRGEAWNGETDTGDRRIGGASSTGPLA